MSRGTNAKKNARSPLDTKLTMVYSRNSSMDTFPKRAGKRGKTRRQRVAWIAAPSLSPLTFSFHAPAAPTRLAGLSAGALAEAEARRRRVHASRFTHQPIVTAELDIFYTISPSHFKNTHLRPLLLNHLRKMPEEAVQFLVDIAFQSGIGVSPMCPFLPSALYHDTATLAGSQRIQPRIVGSGKADPRPGTVTYGHLRKPTVTEFFFSRPHLEPIGALISPPALAGVPPQNPLAIGLVE